MNEWNFDKVYGWVGGVFSLDEICFTHRVIIIIQIIKAFKKGAE